MSADVISGLCNLGTQLLREVAYGSQKLVVENTCFYAGNRARIDDARDQKRGLCKYAGSWREYLEKLGIAGRSTQTLSTGFSSRCLT